MEIKIDILREKFNEYNESYFDNALPLPDFYLLNSYRLTGRFSCRKIDPKRKKVRKPIIEISCYFDWDENMLRDTIIHEMIHYYLAYKKKDIRLTHGDEFKKMCEMIKQKYNIDPNQTIDRYKLKRNQKTTSKFGWFLFKII